jgi:hypothetical protein
VENPLDNYSLDSCVLIDLADRHYPRDVFTTLWANIEGLGTEGRAFVVDEAARECRSNELQEWLGDNNHLIRGDPETWALAAEIVKSVEEDHGVLSVQTAWRGSGAADPFVIALAERHGLTVVTSENRGSPQHPKIPMVCEWRGVACLSLVEFFRAEGWTF